MYVAVTVQPLFLHMHKAGLLMMQLIYKPYMGNLLFFQYNVPFKIISLIGMSQSIGGVKREYPGKTT